MKYKKTQKDTHLTKNIAHIKITKTCTHFLTRRDNENKIVWKILKLIDRQINRVTRW